MEDNFNDLTGMFPDAEKSAPPPTPRLLLAEAQIKHMVSRFLGWKLPKNFNPDNGISFDPVMNKGHQFESRREPVGTNLLDAQQAEAMVRYILEGICARCGGLHGTTSDCSGPKRPSQPLNHTPYG